VLATGKKKAPSLKEKEEEIALQNTKKSAQNFLYRFQEKKGLSRLQQEGEKLHVLTDR